MSTITEMNKFMTKKVVKKINATKSKDTSVLLSLLGPVSTPVESIAMFIMSGHISKVETSTRVSIE